MFGFNTPFVRVLPGVRTVLNAQDFSLIEIPLPVEPPMLNRLGILWDVDHDERVLDVVAALYYRDVRTRAGILALAESKGVLRVFVGGAEDLGKLQSTLDATVDIAVRHDDRWTVRLETVPVQNGKLDYTRLPAGHALHILPRRLPCGLVHQ
jgi:hypothetical protein